MFNYKWAYCPKTINGWQEYRGAGDSLFKYIGVQLTLSLKDKYYAATDEANKIQVEPMLSQRGTNVVPKHLKKRSIKLKIVRIPTSNLNYCSNEKPAPFNPLQKTICSIWKISLPWMHCNWAIMNTIKNSFKKQCAQCSKNVTLPWLFQKVLLDIENNFTICTSCSNVINNNYRINPLSTLKIPVG